MSTILTNKSGKTATIEEEFKFVDEKIMKHVLKETGERFENLSQAINRAHEFLREE